MDRANAEKIINGFSQSNILLIGDIMLDAYIWGKVERISPEAPVPVLNVTKKEGRLGGLANVARNLRSLGAQVTLCSVTGNDENSQKLKALFEEENIPTSSIIFSSERITTVKTRVISNTQHVIRIDEEKSDDISADLENKLLKSIEEHLRSGKIHAVLFEDYNKGVLTHKIIEQTISIAKQLNIPVSVDPKKKNFFSYKRVTLFKPNLKELVEGLKLDKTPAGISDLKEADALLRKEISHEISLITLSEKGVFVSKNGDAAVLPAHVRNISDVSGAGDTVIAVATLCLAQHCSHETIAYLSNLAGGIVCEHPGVVPIQKLQLIEEAIHE